VKISHFEFHQNGTVNVKNTDINFRMPFSKIQRAMRRFSLDSQLFSGII